MVEGLKHRWSILVTLSFSLFTSGFMVIADFLREHPSYVIVVPLWFSWIFYFVPAASITYDLWRFLILHENPWKRTEIKPNWGNLLVFGLVTWGAWLFTHDWVILIPLVVSTLLYWLHLAKTIHLAVLYPASIGVAVLFEFQNRPKLLLLGATLLLAYFLALRRVWEMMNRRK
jgi:hypothetical protein